MRRFKTVLNTTAAILSLTAAESAKSGDVAWVVDPVSTSFSVARNWSPMGVPTSTQTADFGVSNWGYIQFQAPNTLVKQFNFLAGSTGYDLTIGYSRSLQFVLNGGISRDEAAGRVGVSIGNGGHVWFRRNSNASKGAGPVEYYNLGFLEVSSSSLGNALVESNGEILLDGRSSAGSARVANYGTFYVFDDSSLGSAHITNNRWMYMFGNSTAGSATIVNNDVIELYGSANLGNATVTVNDGAILKFNDFAHGDHAHLILNGAGIFDTRDTAFAGIIGSLASESADSRVVLSGNWLSVGLNNRSTTFAGTIGSVSPLDGGLVKVGNGTLTLSGANTYTGFTEFVEGAIAVSRDENLGAVTSSLIFNGGALRAIGTFSTARSVQVNWDSVFEVDSSHTLTMSHDVFGAGTVTKKGGGNLHITGAGTYDGGTDIQGGLVSVGNGGTTGFIDDNVTLSNYAGLAFDRSDDDAFGGNIVGDGHLYIRSGGTTTLSGTNSISGYTVVEGGTLALSGGAAIGDQSSVHLTGGNLRLLADETIGYLASYAETIADLGSHTLTLNADELTTAVAVGDIRGIGGVVKYGDFHQVLHGEKTYTGDTIVHEGILTVEGSLAGDAIVHGGELVINGSAGGNVTVNTGGRLSGSGSIGGTYTNNGGNLAPGNSPGIVVVGGDYVGVGAPTYTVDILADQQDAPLNGTTHDFLDIRGHYTGERTRLILNPVGDFVPTTGSGIEIARVAGSSSASDFFLLTEVQSAENGFFQGFQYVLDHAQGASDSYYLRLATREELAARAIAVSASRQVSRDCFGVDEHHTDEGAWAAARAGAFQVTGGSDMDFDNRYSCVTGGVDLPAGNGFTAGVRGGYADSDAELHLAQGLARLSGTSWLIETAMTYRGPAGYFAGAALGYSSTDWTYDPAIASNRAQNADIDGAVGRVFAGYGSQVGDAGRIRVEGELAYSAVACGDSCFIVGSTEAATTWEGRSFVRYSDDWGGVRPHAQVSLSHAFGDAPRASLAGAVAESDAASALLGLSLGLSANLGANLLMTAEAATTKGLQSEVEGYQGMLSLRKTW